MANVVRYVHIRLQTLKNGEWVYQPFGGATVQITGDTDSPGRVSMRVAFCSKKDTFCKKAGRIAAAVSNEGASIPLRYIGRYMDSVVEQVEAHRFGGKHGIDTVGRCDWNFLIRYFLPKE